MNSRAIAWKTDEHFTAYIMDDDGEMISVELEDKDFTFMKKKYNG